MNKKFFAALLLISNLSFSAETSSEDYTALQKNPKNVEQCDEDGIVVDKSYCDQKIGAVYKELQLLKEAIEILKKTNSNEQDKKTEMSKFIAEKIKEWGEEKDKEIIELQAKVKSLESGYNQVKFTNEQWNQVVSSQQQKKPWFKRSSTNPK